MADGPSAAKKAKKLPECPYGAKCYRKNPQHLADFSHNLPGDDASTRRDVDGTIAKLASSSSTASTSSLGSLPPCKYGAKCYRKNLMHFAEFSHPTSGAVTKSDSDSDTDVIDSDDNDKDKKDGKNDILSRGMSLVKSYSQMSEEQRKELIKQAFEAKKKLQDELAETKKQVAQKEKEVDNLQSQINTGLLLVEGEKEALEGSKMKIFTLAAERAYKEGSADQIHFRLAESQFYRLLAGTNYRIDKVEYVVQPELVKQFQESRKDLKKMRGEALSYPVLGFHGTKEENIYKICKTGFKAPGESGFSHRTDTGWYGAGVYFSEYPAYSMGYIQGSTKLLLCQVLTGKAYQCTKLIQGATLTENHDSHTSPDKKELVIFNSHHILPCYVVHYKTGGGEFKYATPSTLGSGSGDNVIQKYTKCQLAPSSKLFKKMKFLFSGIFAAKQADVNNLVKNHGADKATLGNFNVLITTQDEVNNGTKKVHAADSKWLPKITEDFIYDSILKKKLQKMTDYTL